jgi:hypothetical protein
VSAGGENVSVGMERVVRTGEDGTTDDFSFRSVVGLHLDLATGAVTHIHSHDEFVCK